MRPQASVIEPKWLDSVVNVLALGVFAPANALMAFHAARHVCHALPIFQGVAMCGLPGSLMVWTYSALATAAIARALMPDIPGAPRRLALSGMRISLVVAGASLSIAIALRVFSVLSPTIAGRILGLASLPPNLPRVTCQSPGMGGGELCAIALAIALGVIGYWIRHETQRASQAFYAAAGALGVIGWWLLERRYFADKVLPLRRSKCVSYQANPEFFDSSVFVSQLTLALALAVACLGFVVALRSKST